MATKTKRTSSSRKPTSKGNHRVLKTAAVLAAVGVATAVAARALKTPRGKAMKKKAMTKGRKLVGKARTAARASMKRPTRRSAARAR